jgi:hypothetical protein
MPRDQEVVEAVESRSRGEEGPDREARAFEQPPNEEAAFDQEEPGVTHAAIARLAVERDARVGGILDQVDRR